MNPEVKKLWVTALTDGSYAQSRDRLRTDKGFCCLGVLCDLYAKTTGKGKWIFEEENNRWLFSTRKQSQLEDTSLPDAVKKWAHFNEHTNFKIGKFRKQLALHNDGYRYEGIPHRSFKTIAKAIEEQA